MTHKQILGGRGSAKPFTTLNSIKLMLEIDQLNAENDLLRKTHKTEQNRRRAYEQALTDIKNIAVGITSTFYKGVEISTTYEQLKQILQKCEVLDE